MSVHGACGWARLGAGTGSRVDTAPLGTDTGRPRVGGRSPPGSLVLGLSPFSLVRWFWFWFVLVLFVWELGCLGACLLPGAAFRLVLSLISGVVFSGHTAGAHTRRVCSTQRARARGGATCTDRVCPEQRGAGARCHGGGPAGKVPRGAACPRGGGRFPCHPPGTGHFLRSRAGVAAPGPPPGPVPLPGTGESREASAAPPARAPVSAPGAAPRSGWGRRNPRVPPDVARGPLRGAQPRRAPHPGTPAELISFAGPGRPRVTGVAPGLSGRGEPLSGPGRSPPGPAAPQPRGRDALPRPGPARPDRPASVKRNQWESNEITEPAAAAAPGPAAPGPAPPSPCPGAPRAPIPARAAAGLRAPNESSAVGLPRAGQRRGPGSPGPPRAPGTQFRASSPPGTLVLGTPRCDPCF